MSDHGAGGPGTQTMNLAGYARKGRRSPNQNMGCNDICHTERHDLVRQARLEFVQGGVSAVEVLG